jgi:hypothetical protein
LETELEGLGKNLKMSFGTQMKCQPLKHGLRDTGKNLAIRNEISGT